jgi:ABC-type transport system involved in multi-copper enzyme maturation permease subunit
MLRTLIIKEVKAIITSFGFLVTSALCLVVIPVGIYLCLKDFQNKYHNYKQAENIYHQKYVSSINSSFFSAQGYRPSSPLSIFALGIDDYFPEKVTTSREGNFSLVKSAGINNPVSILFSKIDYLFILAYILSLIAIINTFSSISGDKEKGTLKLVLSNQVARWHILVSKMVGGYLVFIIPYFISLIVSAVLINLTGAAYVFSKQLIPSILLIVFVSMLYLMVVFNMGILFSVLIKKSSSSLICLVLLWVFFMILVPRISPMIAQVIHPVNSVQEINKKKQAFKSELEKEFNKRRSELMEKIISENNVDFDGNIFMLYSTPVISQYDKESLPLEEEFNQRLRTTIEQIDRDFYYNKLSQAKITLNLSRISPVCCLSNIVTDLCSTGSLEIENLIDNAGRFQSLVEKTVYNNFISTYYVWKGNIYRMSGLPDKINSKNIPVPHMQDYQYVKLYRIVKARLIDITLLLFNGIIFFFIAFIKFLNYDVR